MIKSPVSLPTDSMVEVAENIYRVFCHTPAKPVRVGDYVLLRTYGIALVRDIVPDRSKMGSAIYTVEIQMQNRTRYEAAQKRKNKRESVRLASLYREVQPPPGGERCAHCGIHVFEDYHDFFRFKLSAIAGSRGRTRLEKVNIFLSDDDGEEYDDGESDDDREEDVTEEAVNDQQISERMRVTFLFSTQCVKMNLRLSRSSKDAVSVSLCPTCKARIMRTGEIPLMEESPLVYEMAEEKFHRG
jgi:hypothetical protein